MKFVGRQPRGAGSTRARLNSGRDPRRRCRRPVSRRRARPLGRGRGAWRCGRAAARWWAATPGRSATTARGRARGGRRSRCTRRRGRRSACPASDRRQEPGRAARGAGRRGGAAAGPARDRRAGDRLAAAGERVHRGDRLERQDDDGRADRPHPPRRRACRSSVAGNVGTRAARRCPATLRPDAVVVCEASSFQLEDTEAFAPEAAVLLNLAEDHLDRHGTFDAYRAAKLRDLRPPAGEDASPSRPPDLGVDDARRRARRASRSATGRRRSRTATARLWWRGEPLIAAARDPAARRAQPRERDGGGRRLPRPRRRCRRRSATALAHVRRRPAPARGGRHRRRRPLRQRLEGDQRRLGRSSAIESFARRRPR